MSVRFLTALATPAALLPWLGGVAGLLMLAVLAWLGASIFWTVNAPAGASPSAVMETDLQRAQQSITNRHLFGLYVVAGAPAGAPGNIRLNGVIAGERAGQRAYALLTQEGKPAQLVREGEDIAPGISLQRVLARQVEILRGGQSQTLSLPESGKPQVEGGKPLLVSPPPQPEPAPPQAESPKALPVPPQVLPESSTPLPRRGRTRRSAEE